MKNKRFTLIELLVVVAIIGILASLLMPSLKKSRESARRAVCLSNLKQWSTALFLYTDDNDSKLPVYKNGAPGGPAYAEINLMRYMGLNRDVAECPSFEASNFTGGNANTVTIDGENVRAFRTYGMNRIRAADDSGSAAARYHVGLLKNDPLPITAVASDTIFMGEFGRTDMHKHFGIDGYSDVRKVLFGNHQDEGSSILTVGGAAQFIKVNKFAFPGSDYFATPGTIGAAGNSAAVSLNQNGDANGFGTFWSWGD